MSPIPILPDTAITFQNVNTGMLGETTGYLVLNAGDKFMMLAGVDTDTSVQSFASDAHGTLMVLPRPDNTYNRFEFLNERYSFAQPGITDTSRVRFFNGIFRSSADTVDVTVDIRQLDSVDVTTGTLTNVSFTDAGTADHIDRVSGSFLTDGFVAGRKINVATTSTTNNGNFTILTVSALQIILSTEDSLTTEDAATAGTVTINSYDLVVSTPVAGLTFGAASAYVRVPAGETFGFFMRATADTTTILTDTISVTGASHTDFTVVSYDSVDATGLVKTIKLENI